MEEEIKKKLREYLKTECNLIADPEGMLVDAIRVLEFFKKYEEEEEPYAKNTIIILEEALDFLFSQQ